MGKRVLISFLGTGTPRIVDDGIRPMREYRKADYRIGEDTYKDFTFMSAALARHYTIDKILMVGTVHSMWEELYRWFYDAKGEEKVEDNETTYNIYKEIGEHCEAADHGSELSMPHQQAVEQVMGEGSKVVLIKYGVDEEEIRENINRILGLEQYLETNDELIVDITHSFRSLPIFVMNLLIYLQNVSPKKIIISHIYYGMNEASREFGYSPVVDLKAMMDVQEWITGAYAFSMFGNTYKISRLLEKENKSVAPILLGFSDAMNLNYLYPIQSETQKLSGIKNRDYQTDLPKLIITPIVNQFVDTFRVKNEAHRQSHFQLKLADWQYKHKKYAQAYLTSNDALISYVCEINNMPWDDFDCRETAKAALRDKPEGLELSTTAEMKKWFKNHNNRRNGIAHTTKLSTVSYKHGVRTEMELTPSEIIKTLESDISELKDLINLS
jgi:CRISPR-associated Csx2 family protein